LPLLSAHLRGWFRLADDSNLFEGYQAVAYYAELVLRRRIGIGDPRWWRVVNSHSG